ncbi:hypothetical protein CR513_42671, partial [Mucuna pruriens]
MGFSESNLEVCQGTLIKFAEMMVGTGSTTKAVKIRFTMVNAPTSYNTYFEVTSGDHVHNPLMYEIPDRSISGCEGRHGACTTLEEAQVHLLEMDPRIQEDTCPRPNEDLKEVRVGPEPH